MGVGGVERIDYLLYTECMSKWKWLGILFVLLLIVAVANSALSSKQPTPLPLVNEPKKVSELVSVYENEYFYFEYPKRFQLVAIPARDGRVYTSVSFDGDPEKVVKMDLLFRESTQALNEQPDIKMRRANTYQYTEEVARIGDNRGFIFRTADRKERVAYFMKKGRLLQVTLITNGVFSEEIEKEFQDILQSSVWK